MSSALWLPVTSCRCFHACGPLNRDLQQFGAKGKDLMNEETIEFLFPYLDLENFAPAVAKGASQAAEGLCIYVQAMKE